MMTREMVELLSRVDTLEKEIATLRSLTTKSMTLLEQVIHKEIPESTGVEPGDKCLHKGEKRTLANGRILCEDCKKFIKVAV